MNFLVNNQRNCNPANRGTRKARAPKMDGIAWQEHFHNKAKHQLEHHSNASEPFSNADIRNIVMGNNRTIYSSANSPNSTTAWHSISSNHPVVYMAISVGRGNASGEIGIATIDINSPTLVLSQLSDDLWFTGLLTQINIYQPIEIIVPSTLMDAVPTPKFLTVISSVFSKIRLVSLHRRHFNDNDGSERLTRLCAAKYKTVLLKISKKYYALTSASAILQYIGYVAKAEFANGGLKVEYHSKYAAMAIDVESVHRLELLFPLYPSPDRRTCLMGILDKCCTAVGRRHLRVRILQPNCDLLAITSIHECILELKEKPELLADLNGILEEFHSVDQINRIAYIIRQEEDSRAIETLINQALQLKSILEKIEPLIQILTNTNSSTFAVMREALADKRYPFIADRIRHILEDETQSSRNGNVKFFQRLHAVKTGVSGLLDMNRKIYSTFMDNIKDIIEDLNTKYQLPLRSTHSMCRGFHMQLPIKCGKKLEDLPPDLIVLYFNKTNFFITTDAIKKINFQLVKCIGEIQQFSFGVIADLFLHIRNEMDAIYDLTGMISDLDILLSLAKVSISNESWCCPKFSNEMRIFGAIHPFIEFGSYKSQMIPVPNNVLSTAEFNFFIITGPNMSGKTIYLKMIALLQIMAQIGCFVPAISAEFRMCDKLFTRMGFNDNIEQEASSFVIEIREIEYIMRNITPNSLVLIDELCRSTNPHEGQMIAWKLCERMLSMNGLRMNGEFYRDGDNFDIANSSISSSSMLNNSLLGKITAPAIFFSTHFMEITNLADRYLNVVNLSLSANEEANSRLVCTHNLREGRSEITCYGLALAQVVRMPTGIYKRAKEIYNQLMTRELPPFNVSHQCVANVSNATRHSRQSNPVNRTISGATSSIISEKSPTDKERMLYELFANVMEIINDESDCNQATSRLNELMQKFVDILDGSMVNSFVNENVDDFLNDSVRFRESFQHTVTSGSNADNSQCFESIIPDATGILPGTDLDDSLDEEQFHVTQIDNLCRPTQFDQMIRASNENVGMYVVNASNSAEPTHSPMPVESETIQPIFYSSPLDERLVPYSISSIFSSGNNVSSVHIGSPDRKLRKTDYSTDSAPNNYNSNIFAECPTQFFIQSTNSCSSALQIFDDNEDIFGNIDESDISNASEFCSPELYRNSNNTALIELVGADPDDFKTPLTTPAKLLAQATTLSNASEANSLCNFIKGNEANYWNSPAGRQASNSRVSPRQSPINIALFTPCKTPQPEDVIDINMVLPPPPGF